jgi:hypothetical protein
MNRALWNTPSVMIVSTAHAYAAQRIGAWSAARRARSGVVLAPCHRSTTSNAATALAVMAIVALLVVEHVQGGAPRPLRARIAGARTPVRWAAYACAVLTIMTLGVFQSARFIYFQF